MPVGVASHSLPPVSSRISPTGVDSHPFGGAGSRWRRNVRSLWISTTPLLVPHQILPVESSIAALTLFSYRLLPGRYVVNFPPPPGRNWQRPRAVPTRYSPE